MTVSSDLNKISYAGNGTTTVFAVNYYFLADAHLQVVLITADGTETVQTLTTNYTVSGAGNPAGGSVTMLVAPPTGTTVVIQREVPATQETDYLANDPFPAESHERALDKLTMLVQQNERENERALKIPLSAVPTTSTELPIPVGNKLLAWNSNASAVVNFDPSDVITIVGQQTSYGDVFTGNGVTTDFTLTRSPGSVFGIDVSINGVTQVPNVDYILSGTTLSFTTAPPAAASTILARYAEAYQEIDADAQNVRYLPAGTGAELTTVQAKLRETVSVKDFGAVGDGVTDDTAAIQAAIASLGWLKTNNPNAAGQGNPLIQVGGGRLFFPKGKYLVTDTLLYSGGMHWFGEEWGTYILFNPSSSKNCVDENVAQKTWGNTQERFTIKDMFFVSGNANGQIGLNLSNTQGINLENVNVQNFKAVNVKIDGVGGGGYYNTLINCQLRDAPLNLYIGGGNLNSGGVTTVIGGACFHTTGYSGASYNVQVDSSGCAFINTSLEGNVSTAQVLDNAIGTQYLNVYNENPSIPLVERNASSGLAGNSIIQSSFKGSTLNLTNYPQTGADANAVEQFVPIQNFRGFPRSVELIQNGRFKNGLLGWNRATNPLFADGTIQLVSDSFNGSYGALKLSSLGTGSKVLRVGQTLPFDVYKNYLGCGQRVYVLAIISGDGLRFVMNDNVTGNKFGGVIVMKYNSTYSLVSISKALVAGITFLDFQIELLHDITVGVEKTSYVHGVWTSLNGQDLLAHPIDTIFGATSSPSTSAFATWNVGDEVKNSDWALTEPLSWICSQAGTNGVLGSVTCDTTVSSTSVTNISSTVNLGPGMYITIAGVSGIKRIVSISGTTAVIDSAADATTTAATISYSNAVFKNGFTPV